MMIEFRSDHACIMHKSETDWMHARGQPASQRAWPAASRQLAGWRMASARVLEYLIATCAQKMDGGRHRFDLRARTVYQVL